MKGQSTMVMIMVVIMIFIGLAVFLLSIAQTISNEDYMEIYVNSLLVSVMRTDTGHTDSKCKLVSDLVFCAYFTPGWKCEPGTDCRELANRTVASYMKIFANETKNLKYLFTVRPEFITRTEEGEAFTLDMGDQSLKKMKSEAVVYSQPLVISKDVGYEHYTLKMQLIVSSAK